MTRRKEQADDWLWVIDHSAQFGVLKCFLILGIRRSQIPSRPLGLADMTLLDLQPVARSNGAIVEQQLEEQAEATGVPQAILRDEGSDLRAGTRQFEEEHPQTAVVYDVKHHTARVLKRHLEADAQWGEYTAACGRWRPQIQLGLGSLLRMATAETIRQAFASTPVSAVRRWCPERIGSSVQAQRRAAYQAIRKRNENGANPDP